MLSLGNGLSSRPVSGEATLTITLLFAANMIILLVLGAALALAGWKRRDEPYWESWVLANLVLGAALAACIFERHLPPALLGTLPNGLLVLGLALRWRAAREFSGRDAPAYIVWTPLVVLIATVMPWVGVSYAPAFTSANIILACLSFATAYEFWRDRADGLPSRYGLVVAYGVIGVSFGVRVGQGFLEGGGMPMHMPQDMALVVHLVVAVFHTAASGAFALSLAYERANARLAHAASHDALTGLLNRRAFEAALHGRLRCRAGRPFALVLLDIDHFKQVNDRYGHAAGDEALRSCARVLKRGLGSGDFLARIGGEEFAIVLEDRSSRDARDVVDRIRRDVRATPICSSEKVFRITISAGICHSDRADDFDGLMQTADAGLYAAKNKGRNRVESIAA